jgi:HEAT repeat protein
MPKRTPKSPVLTPAQDQLLIEAFIKGDDQKKQAAFLMQVPLTPTLERILNQLYPPLTEGDAKDRLKAAMRLWREQNRVYLADRIRWMRDPRATGPLIDLCQSESDPKVLARLLGTLNGMLLRFPDQRAVPLVHELLRHRNDDIRAGAIGALGLLRKKPLVERVAEFLTCPVESDRISALTVVQSAFLEGPTDTYGEPVLEWSAAERTNWAKRVMPLLRDTSREVRRIATHSLGEIGAQVALPALHAALAVETDEDLKHYTTQAIVALTTPTPSREP